MSFQTVPADPLLKRVETVGRVHPHVKAKIIATDRCAARSRLLSHPPPDCT